MQNINRVKISCIIPTCDRPLHLAEGIASVLWQSVRPFEIIVVNNGRQKITLPAEATQKVVIYDIVPYAGAAQARNFGAAVAKGDFLAFLDDDDIWPPKYLENVLVAIEQGARCVVSRQDIIEGGKQLVWKNPHGRTTVEYLLVRNPGTGGPNTVISRDLFFEVKGYDPKLPPSEDKAMILEVLRLGVAVVTLPDNAVIVGKDRGAFYLTSAARLAEGIFQFTRKYAKLMSWRQYLYNWSKFFYYRYRAGRKWLWPFSKAMRLLVKLFSPFPRIKS